MASINYRLAAPDAVWPAQIQDCKAAIRWLRGHAKQYGYDPNRIGVIGESAGGHLVAMLGTTNGDKTFDVGENQSEVLVEAMEKVGAPFYFHTVVRGDHNPYFGLTYNAAARNFDAGGGGIGVFEDRAVEPLIFDFFRHYLWEGRKELFKGSSPPSSTAPSAVGAEWSLIGPAGFDELIRLTGGFSPTVVSPGAIWTEIESGFHIELKTAIRINVFPLLFDQQVLARVRTGPSGLSFLMALTSSTSSFAPPSKDADKTLVGLFVRPKFAPE